MTPPELDPATLEWAAKLCDIRDAEWRRLALSGPGFDPMAATAAAAAGCIGSRLRDKAHEVRQKRKAALT